MATWSRGDILGFIEVYKSNECLWKIKCPSYRDKFKKDRAYQDLVQFVKAFEPDANRDYVIKKINNLRSSFRKEMKKVLRSQATGGRDGEIYEPKLWYFHELTFLKDQEEPKSESLEIECHDESDHFLSTYETGSPRSAVSENWHGNGTDVETESAPQCQKQSLNQNYRPWRPHNFKTSGLKRRIDETEDSTTSVNNQTRLKYENCVNNNACVCNRPSQDDPNTHARGDQFDTFGQFVAYKLRQMAMEQQPHAEKIISDVLYEGLLGTLSRSACLVVDKI